MSGHIHRTITLLEQELEVTQGRCHELERAIETLRPLAGDVPVSKTRKTTKAAATRTNERTNERTQASGQRAARSLPDDADGAIVATLRKHGGVMKPGKLAAALEVSVVNLRYRLKPLVKSKQVVVTGTTLSRRVSLPGKTPAKEAP